MMADVSNKDMYDSKILEPIDHIKNISKKKSTVDNNRKYLVNHDLDLEKELSQVFLDNLQEEVMWKFMEAETRRNAIM